MSIKYLNWAFDLELPADQGKAVLIALANYADEEGSCFPGQKTLALNTGLNDRTIRRHLGTLEELGYVTRSPRRNGQRRTSDRYYLHMSEPDTTSGRETGSGGHEDVLSRTSRHSEPDTMPDEPLENHQLEPIAKPKASRKPREKKLTPAEHARRQAIFQAVIDATGSNPESRPEKSKIGMVAKELDYAMADIPDNQVVPEIFRRANNYKSIHHYARITPTALLNHWGECKTKTTGVIQTGPTYQDWTHGDPRGRV